jgi:hypothetical protein
MNSITKRRILNIAIVLLLVANITTIALFWLRQEHNKPPMPPNNREGGAAGFLIKELNLDSTQVGAYLSLKQEHGKAAQENRNAIRLLKDSLFGYLQLPNTSDSAVQHIVQSLGANEAAANLALFAHFKKLRSLCNETQKKKFDEILFHAIHMIENGKKQRNMQAPPPNHDFQKRDSTNRSQNERRKENRPPPPRFGERPPHNEDGSFDEHRPPPPPRGDRPFPPNHPTHGRERNEHRPPPPPPNKGKPSDEHEK